MCWWSDEQGIKEVCRKSQRNRTNCISSIRLLLASPIIGCISVRAVENCRSKMEQGNRVWVFRFSVTSGSSESMFLVEKWFLLNHYLLPLALYLHTLPEHSRSSLNWMVCRCRRMVTHRTEMNSSLKLDRFWPRRNERALTPKIAYSRLHFNRNENPSDHFQCIFHSSKISNVESYFYFFLSFFSVYIVVIHKCRRLFNGHTRRRRSHIEMPFQWTTHCQWVLLLLGPCVWNEIWKCGHRTNPVEYKLQVSNDYSIELDFFSVWQSMSGKIERDWSPIGAIGAAGKLCMLRRA